MDSTHPGSQSRLSERIAGAAAALFREKGFKRTIISDISHACRISRKTLYDTFASKGDVLDVVLWRELSGLVDSLHGNDPGIPPEIRLMELCRHILAGMAESRADAFFWALLSSEDAPRLAAYALLGTVIGGLYAQGRAEGVFKPADTTLASDIVLACIRTARSCTGAERDRYRMYNELLVMIAAGVTNRDVTIEFRGFRRDYYRVLGVSVDAAPEDIKQAYRTSAKLHHPDANASGSGQASRYHGIKQAYDILIDPARKQAYDQFLKRSLSTRAGGYAYEFEIA